MHVAKLFIKVQSSSRLVVERQRLDLVQELGIQTDKNARVGSPRQMLMVDLLTLETFGLQPGLLQENVLLDGVLEPFVSGQVIQIGEALIRPTFLCEPCNYLETLQKGLAKRIVGRRGWLGMVVKSGEIAIGDRVVPTSLQLPALSDDTRIRFHEFVARIPPGKVATTADLVLALGVSRAYYRSFPSLIKKTAASLPVHRLVAIDGSLFTQHIPRQAELLAEEGVRVISNQISERDRWHPEYFHPLNGKTG
ncbi:MAG: hypothetical protein DCF22_14415 [Leptolyngbya sp.]|nr:MAG: hypothetical protein DCF22_14415 [Leptolyngbya sp.]